MSGLIADARRQQAAGTADSGASEPTTYGSEPQFNPLAGARQETPKSAWRGALITLAYLGLAAVLLWQGWQWWQTHRAASATAPDIVATAAESPASPLESIDSPAPTSTPPVIEPSSSVNLVNIDQPNTAEPPATSASLATGGEADSADASAPQHASSAGPEPNSRAGSETIPTETELTETAPATSVAEPTDVADSGSSTGSANTTSAAPATETPVETQTVDPQPTTSARPAENEPAQTRTDSTNTTTASADAEPATSTTPSFSSSQRTRTLASIRDQFQAGETDQALSRAANHLRQDDHTESRQLYARLLLRDGQADTARYIVQPGHNMAELELRAYADYQVAAYEDAVRHYQELLRRSNSPQQEWYLWLAICHDNLADIPQATGYYRTYLNQTSGQPDSLIRYARNRLQQLSD